MPDGTTRMNVQDFIQLLGDRLGVPKVFRDSIFGNESAGGRPDIQDSPKGAMGPGQLMPATARRLRVNPRDPAQNIYGSLKLQKQLLDKYRAVTGDEDKAWLLAAAAYNAGEGAVDKHGGIPPYAETQDYVRKLAANMRRNRGSEATSQKPQPSSIVEALERVKQQADRIAPDVVAKTAQPGSIEDVMGRLDAIKAHPSPSPTPSPAPVQFGLTPPPGTQGVIRDAAQIAGMGPLGVFPEDTRRSFVEGVVRAGGSALADLGWASSKPYLSPAGYLVHKAFGPPISPTQQVGESIEKQTALATEGHKADTSLGRFRQAVARGTGASLVEIPKLVGASTVLGPATLPTFGAVSGGRTGGVSGALKGAAMGVVYHYGGQITGQYLGKVANTLFWIGAPAVEQHVVNGVPLDEALGESIPMGLFAGGGGNRAIVELPDGKTRPATPLDIPRIIKGTITLQEPPQVVMSGAAQRIRERIAPFLNKVSAAGLEFSRNEEGSLKLPGNKPSEVLWKTLARQTVNNLAQLVETGSRGDVEQLRQAGFDFNKPVEVEHASVDLPNDRSVGIVLAKQGPNAIVVNITAPEGQNTSSSEFKAVLIKWLESNKEINNIHGTRGTGRTEGAYFNIPRDSLIQQEPKGGHLSRLPKSILPDLVTLGAFHYEAGTRTLEDWMSRMLGELGETPETVRPPVARQLGEVYERSKAVYEQGKAPTFFSGLRQTVLELAKGGLIGKNITNTDRLVNLLKSRGQGEELQASGLLEELSRIKQGGGKYTLEDLLSYLDTKGMTMDVMKGEESKRIGVSRSIEEEEGGKGVLPGMNTRGPYITPGGRDYFEGVIHSNKALDFSTDNVHFGFRPDQISWYRGQLFERSQDTGYSIKRNPATGDYFVHDQIQDSPLYGTESSTWEGARDELSRIRRNEAAAANIAILEEVQSKRAQKAREFGVTPDPDNAHSRLIALQREADTVSEQASGIERELGLSRWEATDEYSRYTPDDVGVRWDYDEQREVYDPDLAAQQLERNAHSESPIAPETRQQIKELDFLRAQLASLEHEIQNLEHFTDNRAEIPWAPHLDTWYEPAIKGFLREAAERLEPDQEGNIRVTWTPASEQLSRYPNARKEVGRVEWVKNDEDPLKEDAIRHGVTEFPETWDVTYYQKQGNNGESAITKHNLIASQVLKLLGEEVGNRVVKGDYDSIVGGLESLTPKDLVIGGDWTIRLYGDTKETITKLYPNKPELQEYAWKENGNKAILPAYLEKYAKAWGGRIELKENQTRLGLTSIDNLRDVFKGIKTSSEETHIHLVIPEEMRQMILKKGQLMFGRQLPALPNGQGYGLRNRITEEQAAQVARETIANKYNTVKNIYGDRIPDPGKREGGFLGLGKRPKLDPRVKTDLDERGVDTSSVGVFFRSPSKWMAGFKDARVDQIAERMFDAEVREHDYTTEWGRRFSAIIDHLQQATLGRKPAKVFGKKADQEALKQTFSDFVDLIEKPFTVEIQGFDPKTGTVGPTQIRNLDRSSSNPMIQRALEEHDALAQEFKDYLIQSYQDRGITINDPQNWGVTEKGYFRHLFPGEDNIFMNGEYQGTGETYLDAIVKANELIEKNPQAQVEIRRRPVQFVDPSLRVSTKSFERLVSKLTGSINDQGTQIVTAREIREDLVGTIGKKENIAKFFAASLKREGYEGYLKDYEQVMRAHYFQLARSQELSKLRKDITPLLEELRREGMRGVVEGIERHLDDLWGKPLAYEKAVGGFIRKFPALRERIANPDLGLEIAARRIASLHNLLKLRYNPKAAFVNLLQPLRTLWPYLTNKDMLEVIKRYGDPKWRQDMTELGVMSGAVKLETGGSKVEGFGGREFLKDPFTYVSGHNRALGYTAGVIAAERAGLTGYDAHKMGMRWAAKVEFDNSKWDAPRFLRHSLGQIFGQYKGFLVKDIENTIDIFSKQSTDSSAHPNLSRASRIAKWGVGTGLFGGLRAATSPLPWMGTALGYSMYLGGAALIKAITGASDKDSKFYSSILFLGLPATVGVDLSASLTPIDDPPGLTAWEKVGRFTLGPTPSALYDVSRATGQLVDPGKNEKRGFGERLVNVGSKLSPYVRMVQRGYQLEQNVVHGKPQYLQVDRYRVPLTKTQMALGAFGVTPATQTLYYEEKEATGKSPLAGSRGPSPFGDPTRGLLRPKPFRPLPTR